MSTSTFMCLSTKWASFHHVDEAWLEFKLKVLGLECWSGTNVLCAWRNSRTVLSSIASKTSVEMPLDWFDSD
jgi:hypothetical protein